MFYSSVVESIVLFNILTYWSNLNVGQKEQTRRLQRKVEKITRSSVTPINERYVSKCVSKVKSLFSDHCHPLSHYYVFMRSGKKLRVPSCETVRYRNSFVPNSIIMYNNIMS